MHYTIGIEFKLKRLLNKQYNKPALTTCTYSRINTLRLSIDYGDVWDNKSLDRFINKIKALDYFGSSTLANTIRQNICMVKAELLQDIELLNNQQSKKDYM